MAGFQLVAAANREGGSADGVGAGKGHGHAVRAHDCSRDVKPLEPVRWRVGLVEVKPVVVGRDAVEVVARPATARAGATAVAADGVPAAAAVRVAAVDLLVVCLVARRVGAKWGTARDGPPDRGGLLCAKGARSNDVVGERARVVACGRRGWNAVNRRAASTASANWRLATADRVRGGGGIPVGEVGLRRHKSRLRLREVRLGHIQAGAQCSRILQRCGRRPCRGRDARKTTVHRAPRRRGGACVT